MIPILTGQFLITDNKQEITGILATNPPDIRVIDLEEGDTTFPLDHPLVFGGVQLLPPVDSIIAEQDGLPDLYIDYYLRRLSEPDQEEYMTAMLCYLCNGGILIVYVPDLRSNLAIMFRRVMDIKYGIRIGIYGMEQTAYNYDLAPVWLWKMYTVGFFDPYILLKLYPANMQIPDFILDRLVIDLNPYGRTIEEKFKAIYSYKEHVKENPRLISPLFSTAR
jgi:hypothetical protein